MYEGETINVINDKITNFRFSKSDFNLQNFETNTTTYVKTQELSTMKLLTCYLRLNNSNFLNASSNNIIIEDGMKPRNANLLSIE